MFYNLQFKRPLNKQEEAQIHWLQPKAQQAKGQEKDQILREPIALIKEIDSD